MKKIIIKNNIGVIALLLFFVLLVGCDIVFERNDEEYEEYDELLLEVSHNSGFYDEGFILTIFTDHNADIFYTLDGTVPTKESTKYIDGIKINNKTECENVISNVTNISSLEDIYFPDFNVDKYTMVRLKAFDNFGNETDVFSFVYFVGLEYKYYQDMPIICIETAYDNLFDYENGIYVTGRTYDDNEDKSGYPEPLPANYNNTGKDWERESYIYALDKTGKVLLDQNCGIRIHGGWTRAFNQKSFNLYARKEYGNKSFDKGLFGDVKIKTFMLRSGGYRDYITKVRDAMIQNLCSGLGFETQANYPCIVFLNGEYWGIYSLQERFADTTIEEHYDIDKDNVIIIEKDELDEGNEEDMSLYEDMLSFFKNNDLSEEENYLTACNLIDIDGFINYMCVELIIGNIDWPNNNFRMWRSRESGSAMYEDCKWRFMLYDVDDSCDMVTKCSASSNPFLNSSHWANGPLDDQCTIGLLFTSFLKNEDFKNKFLSSFNEILENILNYENVENYLNKQIELMAVPMENFYQRFISANSEIYNKDYFINQLQIIKEFFKNRKEFIKQYVSEYIG